MKILFLSANPLGTARLALDREVSKIEDGLQRSKLSDQFQLVSKWAVDSDALRRALLAENPDIVHFSGHGAGEAGLVLVGQDEQPKPATDEALSGLFKQFSNIKCVLLNACYAEVQAKAIVQHIDYVVGMKQAVRDDAAIAFAVGFYDGLGYGKSIDVAFQLGCNAVQFELANFSTTDLRKLIPVNFDEVEPLANHLIPVLLKKEGGLTESSASENSTTENTTSSAPSSQDNSLSEQLRANSSITSEDALRIYRERVKEFLADLKLSQIEKFQLALLANFLGVSEADANQILQEEQNKQKYVQYIISHNTRSVNTHQSWLRTISKAKNYLFACVFLLGVSGAGFSVYSQTNNKYVQLQNLLKEEDWKAADEETARILWKIADRQQERSLRVEDFQRIPCSDLDKINDLWEDHSNQHFGFGVQKQIWLSSDVDSDLGKFIAQVGWGEQREDGTFVYWSIDGQSFELSAPAGQLPLAVTYYGGDNDTRQRYMSRLIRCDVGQTRAER